jgi:hypothetical protein
MTHEEWLNENDVILPRCFIDEHSNDKCISTKRIREVLEEELPCLKQDYKIFKKSLDGIKKIDCNGFCINCALKKTIYNSLDIVEKKA